MTGKRNVTIVLDEETARWVRVEAAKEDTSVSQYLGSMLAERRAEAQAYETARTRFLSRDARPLRSEGDPLPRREELHDRGGSGRGSP